MEIGTKVYLLIKILQAAWSFKTTRAMVPQLKECGPIS